MKGERVRQFFNSETKSLLASYKNIQTLIPSAQKAGAGNVVEEGRYIESLIRSFLNKHLPQDLKAFSGFILRPAAKFGNHDRTRRITEVDKHSTQIDILIYDIKNYPIYEQFEEFVIVPPEGVVSIISVKKNLYSNQLEGELLHLKNASNLCVLKNSKGEVLMRPTTCLISFSNRIQPKKSYDKISEWIYKKVKKIYTDTFFDECINSIIVLDAFTLFKKRPNDELRFDNKANYFAYNHADENHLHYGIQFLITGVLAAYYHPTRKSELRPGYTSFPTTKCPNIDLGAIIVKKLR